MTAAHCLEGNDGPIDLQVDGKVCKIERAEKDVTDHVLVMTKECNFSRKATIGVQPKVGTRVFYWGNPFLFEDMLRIGYVAKVENSSLLLDINGYNGDSGSAIFTANGKIVGVVNYGYTRRAFSIVEATPFTFTRKQYRDMGVEPPYP